MGRPIAQSRSGTSSTARPSTDPADNSGPKSPPQDASDVVQAPEFARLVDAASDAIIAVSRTGAITSWSTGAEKLFGYAPQEALGLHISMLAPPGRVLEGKAFIERALAGDPIDCTETERVRKDGCSVSVLLSLSAISGEDGELVGAVGIYRDVSKLRDAEEALRESEHRYQAVVEALSEGVVMHDSQGKVLAFNQSAERILDLSAHELAESAPSGPLLPFVREDGSRLPNHEYPTMISLRTGEPQHGTVLGVRDRDGATRWISVNSRALFHLGDEEPYAAVASFTDITDRRTALEDLQEARGEDLKRLGLVAEYRDDDTNRHTERVARVSELLGRELGMDEESLQTLRLAAPLHDVGKIGIPDSILLKPGKLTVEEFEVMKTHTVIGGRILCHSRAPVLRAATAIAFNHHERWDGNGYPVGLQGREIPLVARIVAVADAFDAMTHPRPYKAASSVRKAVAEIERCGGSQFDPQVVSAFMTLDHKTLVDRGEPARRDLRGGKRMARPVQRDLVG
jgi:PAS domain S-box-containing protein